MSDTVIRLAVAGDIAALHGLVEGAYRGERSRAGWTYEADLLGGQRTDVAALAAILADADQRLLVAEGEAGLAGCVQVSRRDGGTAALGLLSVDPARQAAGLGRQLIAAAERTARDLFGAATMEMTVIRQRDRLIAYYERRGYALTGEERPFPYGDERFGLPLRPDLAFVVLTKPL
ncbi:GNAT family N-acetyltransferase [Sphingomonas profundi]|uniref:GNAT family N-acetyltransferase n=1 Tax=Alterirhizorhabdus profundi TaxID=2681549 RepID=UPI0012E8769E|nr:GNAT family N-acetyltransferase [Sphingomonas profundi]